VVAFNTSYENQGVGLASVSEASIGYADNVLWGNNGGDQNPQVSTDVGATALELGNNLCGVDMTCP
jgi:hypothetical protein